MTIFSRWTWIPGRQCANGECVKPLLRLTAWSRWGIVLATNRMASSLSEPLPFTPTLWQETLILGPSVFVWIVGVPPEKELEEGDLRTMTNPAHSSPSPCSAANENCRCWRSWQPQGHHRGGKSHRKRRSQFDLQCNYSRAVRQHKFGPGAGIFLFVQKLIFVSKKKPFNFWNQIGQGRGNAEDHNLRSGVSALSWAFIFLLDFEENRTPPPTAPLLPRGQTSRIRFQVEDICGSKG